MPWECKKCANGTTLRDDAPCPTCASTKASWTMVPEKTRTFVLGGKKFEVLRGAAEETWPADDPRQDGEDHVVAERAPVMTRAAAAKVEAGHLPPSRRLLRVRLFPKNHKDLTVHVSVNFGQAEVQEHELAFEGEPALRPDDGSVDVLVLLVRGAGPEVSFPGVHVIDVAEDSPRGFAPAIEVRALGKPLKELPTEDAAARVWLSARFYDRAGQAPLAGLALTVEGREVVTDAQGEVVLEDMPWRDLDVRFDRGRVLVPAVHDPSILTHVRLGGVEPAAAAAEDGVEEVADGYPAWLPRPDDPDDGEPHDDPLMTGEWGDDDDEHDFDLIVEAREDEDGDDDGEGPPPDEDLEFELVVHVVGAEDA